MKNSLLGPIGGLLLTLMSVVGIGFAASSKPSSQPGPVSIPYQVAPKQAVPYQAAPNQAQAASKQAETYQVASDTKELAQGWKADPIILRDTKKGYYAPKVTPYPADKPVYVNGYYRKNGTYVSPHFRKLPTYKSAKR